MNLNVETWKEFCMASLFDSMYKGEAYSDEDLENIEGGTIVPYITRTDLNNGCKYMAKITNDFHIEDGNAITIGDTTATCFYQKDKFITGDHIVILRADWLNLLRGLFVLGLLNQEKLKYSYGRAYKIDNIKKTLLKLPIQHHSNGTPVIDPGKKYSKKGYIPDWQFMEDYIKSLHYKPLTTSRAYGSKKDLNVANWKEFQLSRICHIDFGNKFDNDKMTYETPSVNFVSRTADNNGVSDVVDRIEGADPYPAGCLSVALGGSIGSCFLQKQPFYTGQNVAVLIFPSDVSIRAKLFFSKVFMFEVKGKFVAFGRELNKHLKTDLTLYLPIQYHPDGTPVIDPEKKYNKKGYVPDWQFMEDYINTLLYSDKIK